MALAWLCQIDAFARDDGAATTIRLASHDDDRLCHLDPQTPASPWWPAIARLPTLAYDFFDGAFGGEIATPSGRADLTIESIPRFAELMLHDARIRWWSGELGAAWGSFTLRFDGKIDNQPALRDGVAGVEFRVDDRWLDDPILSTYAGTTGAEGEAALKGQVKPLMLGAPRMVEGVLIDTIDTIIQLSDGAIEGVEVAFENAQRFPTPMTNYASFAALDAATIAPAFVATALASGLTRHGAPGDGVLTYDVRGSNAGADGGGWVRRTGAIVKRLAARQGKLAKVDAAAMASLDIARPWNVSIALTSQTTMRELVQSLAQSINAVALVTWTGLLTILPIDVPESATAVGTLASDGSANPPVGRVDQLGIAPPFWRLGIEAEVTQRVHSTDEIRFTAYLVEVGIYSGTETYREGNIVSIPDGSRWLYISAAPSAGNSPSDVSAYWARLSDATVFSPTDVSPNPPTELPEGTLWIAPDGHLYRFGLRPWTSNGAAWTSNGDPWLGGGYSDAQDQAAVNAQLLAAAVTAQVARIASDNWLTAGEKAGLVLSHRAMIENHLALDAKALALGAAGAERTAATAAVNALNAFLVSLSPAWNDTTQDTPANGATLTTLWGAAAQKVALLQAAIQGLPGAPGTPGTPGAPGTPGTPGTDGVDGIDGSDGKLVEFVWKRAATQPAAPTGNGIPDTWSDDPPAGADPLWMSKAKQELDGTLVAGETWSPPIRHNGTDGANGAPGISPVLAVASPTSKQFTADADGVVKTGQLAFPVTITATKAGAAIGGTVTILGVSGCTATAVSGGFTIDTVSADSGYVNWRFTATDGQTGEGRVSFSRQRDPTGGGQVLVNFSSTSWWGSGSYGASGPSTVLAASSAGKLKLTGYASFYCATNGSATLTGKLQYRAVGSGTWIDAGFSGSGIATRLIGVPGEPNDNSPGVIGISGTVTGLTADGSYEMQMVGNRSTSGTAISSATGYVSMQQVA